MMKKTWFHYIRAVLLISLFSFLLVLPQWRSNTFAMGADSLFHYNRFYDAAMQIREHNFSYFVSIYGFQQSGRIVNALYGPFFAYFQGILVLLGRTWFGYQLVSRLVLGIVSGTAMYSLLRTLKIKDKISFPLAFLYLTTFSIQYWTMRQGFTSWGAAVMPFSLIPAFRFVLRKEINPLQLAFSVSLMFHIHLLSTLFLILIYIPFFAYGFLISQNKKRILAQVALAVGITLLLTTNVWLALLFLKADNNLLNPFINETMVFNTINNGSKYWLVTPVALAVLMVIQLVHLLYRWKKIESWERILNGVYLVFLFLASSYFPWGWLIARGNSFAKLVQFPFRFFVPATILIIVIAALIISRLPKQKYLSILLLICALLGAGQAINSLQEADQAAKASRYVMKPGKHTHPNGSYEEQYYAMFEPENSLLLRRIEKSTPDYVPLYGSIKGYNTYDEYAKKIIFNKDVKKTINKEGNLTLSWDSKGGRTELPIEVYKRTVLTLNGKTLSPKDYTLSTFGVPTVSSKTGHNSLTLTYKSPGYFGFVIALTLLTWLALAVISIIKVRTGKSYPILLSD